ncbi:MAG: acetyl-CoA carboxylase biotin carboxylase subunit [Bryobacterales bacterium]|nr:acetyl-CoA carboxylase biotin carboxylase subunit [Bryobacterales bacterium]
MFRKILVANRGEIAVRVIRTCREMGILSVAVYSEADRTAKHVRLADEAVAIGPAPAPESYLNIERVVAAALGADADAVHPGYGFLSESADFAEACGHAGLKFIGPPSDAILTMGIKTRARKVMEDAGVPVVPGTAAARSSAEAAALAAKIGYPVMLKAAAGGGGKGMRLVEAPDRLATSWAQAQGEALQAFGDDSVYLERAIVRPRHVEVQILADEHGSVVHLGERECSLQRRHQKVLEETPSPLLAGHSRTRESLCSAAVAAARAAGYANAGTVEFLMDADRRFYFLEMNTRLQVEHPVTELVTGIDLVREQILVAAGKPLRHGQSDIGFRGHAMECRVYAEDPKAGFLPSPGRISRLVMPEGPGIRVDSGAEEGWTVPLEYDPLIAKLCAWAPTRPEVVCRLRGALREAAVGGIATTLGFFRELLEDPRFQAGEIDTGFIERGLDPAAAAAASPSRAARLAAMLVAVRASQVRRHSVGTGRPEPAPSRWKDRGRRAGVGGGGR